jgi:hypothetical protein
MRFRVGVLARFRCCRIFLSHNGALQRIVGVGDERNGGRSECHEIGFAIAAFRGDDTFLAHWRDTGTAANVVLK